MSRDFKASRIRTNAIIGDNSGVEPSILLYPNSQATNNTGSRAANLTNFLSDTTNYPASSFLYVYGMPTTSSAASGITPAINASVFGGDIVLKGTIFTDYLRTTDGALIDFAGIAYITPQNTNYISDPNGPTTSGDADKLLDAEIKTNRDTITTNTTNIASLTSLLDAHELSVGLAENGTFVANVNTNYITTATSVRNEVFLLDERLKSNSDNIDTKANLTDFNDLQTEVDSIEAASGLDNSGAYVADVNANYISDSTSLFNADIKLDTQIKVNADAISALGVGNIGSIQSEVNLIEAAVGLDVDGTYLAHENSNYLNNAQNVKDALTKLDDQLKLNSTNIDLKATAASATSLQAEIDAIELAVGLNENGTYSAHIDSNYLDNASSIKNALSVLDVQLKSTQTSLNTAETDITTLQTEMDNIEGIAAEKASQIEVDAIELSVGLAEDGTYLAHNNSNYIDAASSIKDALSKLDTQLKTTQDEVDAEEAVRLNEISLIQSEVDSIENSLGLSVTGTRPNYANSNFISNNQDHHAAIAELDKELKVASDDISTLEAAVSLRATIDSLSSLQAETDSIETAVGLNADGTYSAHAGSNYIDAASSTKDALSKLDTQLDVTQTDLNVAEVNIINLQTDIGLKATSAELNTLQAETDSIEIAVGLNADGTYFAHIGSNYIDAASSTKDALSKLDTQLDVTQTDLNVAEVNIINLQTDVALKASTASLVALQSETDAIELSAGFNADGTYSAHAGSNYIDAASSTKDALSKLDTQLKATQDEVDAEEATRLSEINSLNSEVDSIENSLGLTLTGLRPNYANTNYISNADSHHAAIGKIDAAITTIQGGNAGQTLALQELKNSVGTNNEGELEAFSNTNFLDDVDVVKTALTALDTNIGNRSIFNIVGIDHENKDDGKILQYDLASDKFVYVDASVGPQGPAGGDGRGISSVTENNDGTFTLNFTDGLNPFTTIDMTGPQGIQGIQGDQGIQGLQGDSAYQVWLDEGNVGDETAFLSSLQGDQGPQGLQGDQGTAGLDAPTISGVSISGSTVTTSFNGANDAVVNEGFNVSIADLDNVSINLQTIANGKILKWDDNSNSFIAADDINGVGGGGGSLSVTDNTTTVDNSATLDVQQLAAVTDSGNNEATLVGIIGNAEDADYTDGLFTDFTNTTTIGTAIDRFNEVLKALAPSPAPDLDQFDVDTANSLLQNIKLSFGSLNNQSASGTPYFSVENTSGFDATDVNEIFAIETENGNYRLGVYTGSTSITGTLNEDVSNDTYTNNIVNYEDNSFSEGDQGAIELWLNGQKIHEVDLSDPANGEGDYLNADGSGFINLTSAISGKFSSDTEFPTFKHRQGKWKVHSASQRNGWNYVQVKHIVGVNTKTTGYAEWVNDDNNEDISVTNKGLTLTMAGSKYLSGIQYHTSGTATYTADIDNFYKYVYKASNVTFSEAPEDMINFSSIAVPTIDTVNGEDHAKQISLSQTANLLPVNNRLLNQSLTAGFDLQHPIKADITANSTNQTVTGILLDATGADSTVTDESFNDENYRQYSTNAYTQTDLADATDSYAWDSEESVVGVNASYNEGLVIYNSRLYSPKSVDLPNNGDFSALDSSYANPDYSSIDNSNRYYIRKFKNTSGNTVSEMLLSFDGNSSTITDTDTPTSSQIDIEIKIPSKNGFDETNWMSLASAFDLENYLNDIGTTCGDSEINTDLEIDGNLNNLFATFGRDEVLNGEYILARVKAAGNWSGYLDSITANFTNILGNVDSSPNITSIDSEQSGVTGKLSFGATNTIANFSNYTADINTEFDLSGNKSGIFNNDEDISGFINNLTAANGNSYDQYAFGGDDAELGTLSLQVNGVEKHSIDLSSMPYLSGDQLNNNGSGFKDLTIPAPGRDANNRPDYNKLFRTSKFYIDILDQRLGYNFAKVVHTVDANSYESNLIEWINDDNTDAPDFTDNGASTYTIDAGLISSTETNSLSGITYYKEITNVPYEISVKNLYKNIYSAESDAVLVSDADNNSKIKSILLTGTNNNAITNSGSHSLPGNLNSGSKALPSITAASDESEVLKIESIFEVNYIKSILDLDAVDNYANMNDITINTTVKHPLTTAANGKTTSGVSETATSSKFLQYSVSSANQTLVQEDFSNESRRIPVGVYANQASASGASWDSTSELTDGLMVYDEKLRYPDGDFRDLNANIHAPENNPNYTGSTGTKYFYRIFQNTTQNSKTGFDLQLQGDGSTIVDPDTAFSATNIKISVKIPETGDSQSTGYLNVAKAFETGEYNDGDGSLSGNLSNTITDGQTTTNTVTFGQKFLQPNEYFVLRVEANENWTGYLSNITVDWS